MSQYVPSVRLRGFILVCEVSMKTIEEVQELYKKYNEKKNQLEVLKAVLAQKVAERKVLEEKLVAKFGENYEEKIQTQLARLEEITKNVV